MYIGQSVNIHKRLNAHKASAFNENDKCYNYPLYRAIRKYGLQNFLFDVVEECSLNELNEKEIYWISFYDSFYNGYNLTFGGDAHSHMENKEKIIGIINDLENTDMFQQDIANKWDISEEMVQGINTGRYWRHDRDYPIRKHLKENNILSCSVCGSNITKYSKTGLCHNCYSKLIRKTMWPNRETLKELIRATTFKDIGELYGVSDNTVKKWCKKYGLPSLKKIINKIKDEEWENI